MSNSQDNVAQLTGPRKKSKLKLILLIVVPLVLLLGGGGAAYYLLVMAPADEMAAAEGGGESSAQVIIVPEPEDPLPPGTFVPLRDITVNLKSPDSRNEFLRLGLTLEFTPPGLPPGPEFDAWTANITSRSAEVIDALQPYLRELTAVELRGSAGTYRLHQQILHRVKLVLPDLPVQDVQFRLLMVQ